MSSNNDPIAHSVHQDGESFLSTLLKPGSSLHPTFLLILDGAFALLLAVFLCLLWVTSGSIHIFALIGIELCLWASVKWFVRELAIAQLQEQTRTDAQLQSEAAVKEKMQ